MPDLLNAANSSTLLKTQAGIVDKSKLVHLMGDEVRDRFPYKIDYVSQYKYLIWSGDYYSINLTKAYDIWFNQSWDKSNQLTGLMGLLYGGLDSYLDGRLEIWFKDRYGDTVSVSMRGQGLKDSIFTLAPLVEE